MSNDAAKELLLRNISVSRTGCWLFQGPRGAGYGIIRVGERRLRAHVVSYELFNGPIPDGLVVMHRCDVRNCVNPAHLELGSVAENNEDARRKGRATPPPPGGARGYRGGRRGRY